jgi:hypothetical protein
MIDAGDMQVFFMLMSFLVTSFLVSTRMMTESRGHVVPTHNGQRMQWDSRVQTLRDQKMFDRTYRMTYFAFCHLVEMLRPALEVDHRFAKLRARAGAIIPELCLHCVIRYLAGGSYLNICAAVQIAPSTFYAIIVWSTMEIICSSYFGQISAAKRRESAQAQYLCAWLRFQRSASTYINMNII